jgi:adenylylsulfate kinase-like enzyme
MNKFCLTFAGVVGSSKTPITNYLSGQLNLPVLNNDAIRTEVLEDLGEFNFDEYIKRRNERAESILKKISRLYMMPA